MSHDHQRDSGHDGPFERGSLFDHLDRSAEQGRRWGQVAAFIFIIGGGILAALLNAFGVIDLNSVKPPN